MHHLVGSAEIGEMLGGVSRQRVTQIVNRPDFPKPEHELRMGKVWRTEDVARWIEGHREDAPKPLERPGNRRRPPLKKPPAE